MPTWEPALTGDRLTTTELGSASADTAGQHDLYAILQAVFDGSTIRTVNANA